MTAALPCAAATLTVAAGGNLQAALNAAKPGDTIVLAAGAVFTGNFVLPAKSGTTYITVRSAAPDSRLPPSGTRMSPAYAPLLPKIRSTRNGAALRTKPGANYWRLMFLEFLPNASDSAANLIELGSDSATSASSQPHHVIIDRCYLHGGASFGQRRGVALNSGKTEIVNSYFSDFKKVTQDTQAIGGWNGPGPYLIENNYLEAAGENLMFGGNPAIPNLIPSDITIRRNLISRPMAWRSQSWTVKNEIELKSAQRVTIEGNTIQNHWAQGQQGFAIVLTPRNQFGQDPWAVVKDVVFQNNIVRHVAAGFNISGYDDLHTSQRTRNITIRNNLFYDVSTAYGTSGNPSPGKFAQLGNSPVDITIDHNTVDNDGSKTIGFYGAAGSIPGFVLTNNLLRNNTYGVYGDKVGQGTVAFNTYCPDAIVLRNTFAGASATLYPTGNEFPSIAGWLADFLSAPGGDYRLDPGSPWSRLGTDGKDLGVDFGEMNAAMSGSRGSMPPPSGGGAYGGQPAAVPGTIQAEKYDTGGERVAYHDTTSGNSGGAYRSDDVDIRTTTDSSGRYNLKSVRAGEWLKYTVSIAAAGSYTLGLRVASSGPGGTAHLEVDGANATGAMTLPDTKSWSTWKTISKTGLSLPSGTHVLRLVIDANGSGGTAADINWLSLQGGSAPPSGSTPYLSVTLPGTIQAENYDKGGEGVAYRDTTSGNSGGVYRSNDVDLQIADDTGGGYKVKTAVRGEWLNYTAKVAQAGTYRLNVRVASHGGGGAFHVDVDGTNVTGTLHVPDTGGWQAWQTVSKTGVALDAGSHVFRLVMDATGTSGLTGNFNWLKVTTM